jgi:protein-serine/threonine kinase
MSSSKTNGSTHFPQKLRNFFRISSQSNENGANPKAESKLRQSRFLSGMGRHRSTTVASEGNPLDDSVSPTALANPYFAHQGPPAIRHHNDGSVPPSPPDSPITKLGVSGGVNDQAITAGKEELARKLRRVASAPNTQGFFQTSKSGERPSTAELGKEPLVQHKNDSTLSMVENSNDLAVSASADHSSIPSPGQIRQSVAFRRTYSSNSIKVRNVEVGPGSFDKIKLIGKGDVGKVYLVREKKSSRLYAMKGNQ